MNLTNKNILVTGSSSGIGQAVAVACAKLGAFVVVHYRNNKEGAEATLDLVKEHSDGMIVQADVTKLQDIQRMFNDIQKEGIALDALVNNAAEAKPGDLDDYSVWEHQWNLVVMSVVMVSNEFITHIGDNRELAKIVNISSIYGMPQMSNPRFAQYSSMKSAVNSITESYAKIYAPKVLVNAIAPGWTWTPAWEGTPEDEKKTLSSMTKINRFVKPEEIASLAVELLQNDAITGEIYRVDGGLHLQEIL